jgi:hypothetical protein
MVSYFQCCLRCVVLTLDFQLAAELAPQHNFFAIAVVGQVFDLRMFDRAAYRLKLLAAPNANEWVCNVSQRAHREERSRQGGGGDRKGVSSENIEVSEYLVSMDTNNRLRIKLAFGVSCRLRVNFIGFGLRMWINTGKVACMLT